MEVIKRYKKGNEEFRIIRDDNPESPRTWDNLGIIICKDKRYNLSDEELGENFVGCFNDLPKWLEDNKKSIVCIPIYLYDHSGITIKTTPFGCKWDSSSIGYIYTTEEKAKTYMGINEINKEDIEEIKKILNHEIKTFNSYIIGECYGYNHVRLNKCKYCDHISEHQIDSCYGFLGDIEESGILDNINIEEFIEEDI